MRKKICIGIIIAFAIFFLDVCLLKNAPVEESESRETEILENETEYRENILTDSSVIDLGNHIVAYRASSDIIDIGGYQGEYLVIHDLASNEILYLPDVYEEVYDMEMEGNESIFISYSGAEENSIQEVHIPVQFPMQTNTVYEITPMDTKLLTELKGDIKACVEELPRLIWEENAVWEGRTYAITFEQTSPVYLNPHSEVWGRYADYCLMVKDEEDNIISEQIMVNYPICYEEVYWFTDFSGDGFPDIAFCTEYIPSKETSVHLEFMIWNAETEEYEAKPLPVRSIGETAWNKTVSSVILFYKRNERTHMGMYSFREGDWKLAGELIPVYDEENVNEDRDLFCIGWKEIFYENGEAVEENGIIKEEKTYYTPWFDDESIWGRDNKENEKLYPSDGWDIIEVMIGEDTTNKYVREQ
ncbi:MAG: hypothetical protein NC321_00965 [Clostridium sp.]|nr:hypothetical protein [Clostridium sp.]